MPLTIVQVLPSPENVGGTERTAHLAADGLRRRGHRVHLLHDQQDSPPNSASHYDGHLGSRFFFTARGVRGLGQARIARQAVADWLNALQADVVHVHGYPRTANLRWLARHWPTVATVHVPLCPNGARYLWKSKCVCDRKVGMSCVTQGYLRDGCGRLGNGVPMSPRMFATAYYNYSRLYAALQRCSGLIVPSHWMAGRLASDGLAAQRLSVVFPPIVSAAVHQHPATEVESPPAVLFAGRLVEVKGAADVLIASAGVSHPHQVWIVGDGPQRAALEQQAAQLQIAQRVRFLGNLPPHEVDAIRRRAAVAVLPSKWPETFAMVGAEAMAAGLPVIAYSGGAVSEWLQDGVTGRLIPSGDVTALQRALDGLLGDAAGRDAMAAAAQVAAARWSVDAHARRLEEVYGSCERPGIGVRPSQRTTVP